MGTYVTDRRRFLASSAALSAASMLPGAARAQSGEPFVFCTGFGFIVDFLEVMNAQAGGHWREAGLDGKVIGAQGAAQSIQLLASGQAHMIRTAAIEMMRAVSAQNLPLLAVATIYQGSTFSMVSPEEAPLRGIEDLRGKTIGIVSVGGATDVFIDLMCARAGIPKGEVRREVVGNSPGALGLVRQGRIHGFITSSSVVAALQVAKEKVVVWNTDRYAPMPSQCYFVTRQLAQERPQVIVRALRGLKASVDQLVAGPIGPLIARASKDFDIPGRRNLEALTANADAAKALYFSQGRENLLRNVPKLWRDGADAMAKAGLGDLTKSVESLYTNRFLDQALHHGAGAHRTKG